jgi:hypothetical protein
LDYYLIVDDERVVYNTYCTEGGNKEDETHEISKDSLDDRHMVYFTAMFLNGTWHFSFCTGNLAGSYHHHTHPVQADSETSDQGVWGVYGSTLARRF